MIVNPSFGIKKPQLLNTVGVLSLLVYNRINRSLLLVTSNSFKT
jgi:hypothetical protein